MSSRNRRHLMTNIERARAAGIIVGKECEALRHAIITKSTHTNGIPVTDARIAMAIDSLWNDAAEQGKQNDVKWLGFEI